MLEMLFSWVCIVLELCASRTKELKTLVWSQGFETYWFNTFQTFGTKCTLKWKAGFFLFVCLLTSLDFKYRFWEIRDTSSSLLTRAEKYTGKTRGASVVFVPWLSQGCTVVGFPFLCGHVFPIRQGCVTHEVGQHKSVHAWHINRVKGPQLHSDTLPAGIFCKLGALGLFVWQKRCTPVCFGLASVLLHGLV